MFLGRKPGIGCETKLMILTLYHGTDEVFTEYKKNSFFSTNPNFSEKYGKHVHEERVSVGKVFDSLDESCIKKLMDICGPLCDPYDNQEYNDPNELMDNIASDTWELIENYMPNIESIGYDSIKIYEGGIENHVVFDPSNIEPKLNMDSATTDQGAGLAQDMG